SRWRTRLRGGVAGVRAAAVASGLCAGALGSDTGGSIRIPASLCGITGIKPTYGRVSRAGILPLAWSLDHVGPMCRTAADCALMLGAIAGYDPREPPTHVLPGPDSAAALTGWVAGLRIGALRAGFADSAAPAVQAAVARALETLAGLGASVRDVSLETPVLAAAATSAVVAVEAYAYHEAWIKARADEYAPDVRDRLRAGAFVSGVDYVRAQRARTLIAREIDAALAGLDVLVAPTTPIAAPGVDEAEVEIGGQRVAVRPTLLRYTRPFNASGHPAASVAGGFTPDGLPIGLQVVGRPFDEATVL